MPGTVWAVTGSRFTADAARAETFKSTGGSRGVTLPGDLKVTALATPGASVQVAPGGATVPAGYPAAPGQSYGVLKPATETVPVVATGSGSAVTKYLILRVTDPQFEGSAPANPLDGPYESYQWVSSITGLNYPYVPLVRLVQPASTSTITNAMLTDLRELTNPRMNRQIYCAVPAIVNLTNTAGFVDWPQYNPLIKVPDWATHITAMARVHNAQVANGTTYGYFRLVLGNAAPNQVISATTGYDTNTPGASSNGVRIPTQSVILGDAIPLAMRGGNHLIKLQGYKQASAETGYLRSDAYTQVEYDVQFSERAV